MDSIKQSTVVFGYVLFALSLLALFLFTVIPFGSMLFIPAVKHPSVVLILSSLIAGAILPTLISYFIGERSTRTKRTLDHHFNGVLFGIAAYWLANLFSLISSDGIAYIRKTFSEPLATIINAWPILATVLLISLVAMGYAKQKRNKGSLLEFRPFQYVLFGGIIACFAYGILYSMYHGSNDYVQSSLYGAVVPLLFFGFAFAALPGRNVTKPFRTAFAAIAFSIGYIASGVSAQLLPGMPYQASQFLPLAIGFLAMVVYLVFIRRTK